MALIRVLSLEGLAPQLCKTHLPSLPAQAEGCLEGEMEAWASGWRWADRLPTKDCCLAPHVVVVLDGFQHRCGVGEGLAKALEQGQRHDVKEADLHGCERRGVAHSKVQEGEHSSCAEEADLYLAMDELDCHSSLERGIQGLHTSRLLHLQCAQVRADWSKTSKRFFQQLLRNKSGNQGGREALQNCPFCHFYDTHMQV